ncbi:hypothetical protein COU58_03765 [Candidatus Pacearchaeota archaeon CG10_big_fil_rev_8_21_14_0_10_32_42]|nr:MAG: hypothetical protein COU58_03765 [Candidatus Pacearchaeota archaeon CG10_big_fil_rev_8_21_14_0_10_32_42]
MAKVNTEKPAGKDQSNKTAKIPKTKKERVPKATVENKKIVSEGNVEAQTKDKEIQTEVQPKTEEKVEIKKTETKKVKKNETSINIENLKVSTKVAISICKFMLNKKIEKAIKEIEEVTKMRRAIPMKGEYAHRKGKMMSGKYPVNAAKEFLILLKSLQRNATHHEIDNPIITEAIANKGSTVYASSGRTRKRTHIRIVLSEKKLKQKMENKK